MMKPQPKWIFYPHVIDLDWHFIPLLHAYGRPFPTDEETYSGRQMTPKGCYRNAWLIATESRKYRAKQLHYTEGYVLDDNNFAFHHAWLVDGQGNVTDPTIRGDSARTSNQYFGITFTREYVRQVGLANRHPPGILFWENPIWNKTHSELRSIIQSEVCKLPPKRIADRVRKQIAVLMGREGHTSRIRVREKAREAARA